MNSRTPLPLIAALVSIGFASALHGQSDNGNRSDQSTEETPAAASGPLLDPEGMTRRLPRKEGSIRRSMSSRDIESIMKRGTDDIQFADGINFERRWFMRVGVTKLRIPSDAGWIDMTGEEPLYDLYSAESLPGESLSRILANQRFISMNGSKFVSFYALLWTPEADAYKLFQEKSFEARKEKIKAIALANRKDQAQRADFVTFSDYFNYKFGRDDEMENFVDGYFIKATESGDHITYFFTSEFILVTDKGDERSPMVATTTYFLVKNKLLRADVRMLFRNNDDVQRILEYTESFIDEMRYLNGAESN